MTISNDEGEIRQKVRTIIAAVLRISGEEVKDDSDLVGELGADSMDFIDIMFSLGREFDVEFCPEGMVAKLELCFGRDVLSNQGLLTEQGARVFHDRRPEIAPEKITPGMPFDRLHKLVTTESWSKAVMEILAARPSACTKCGSETLSALRVSTLSCTGCGAEVECPTQADILEAWACDFQEAGSRSRV